MIEKLDLAFHLPHLQMLHRRKYMSFNSWSEQTNPCVRNTLWWFCWYFKRIGWDICYQNKQSTNIPQSCKMHAKSMISTYYNWKANSIFCQILILLYMPVMNDSVQKPFLIRVTDLMRLYYQQEIEWLQKQWWLHYKNHPKGNTNVLSTITSNTLWQKWSHILGFEMC